MSKRRPTLAIAYDFDGTLAPGNMQEHQFVPDIGKTPAAFWAEVRTTAEKHQADEVLVYMNLMLRRPPLITCQLGAGRARRVVGYGHRGPHQRFSRHKRDSVWMRSAADPD